MTETNETSNQNELDLTDLKYYTEIISRLDAEIRDSVYSITSKDMKEIARYGKVARTLEKITNVYPAMNKLLIDFKEHIDELPDFVEVANHEL
ncbi:hypothetical protein [Weissella paramesenteroides]|uniref:hypothetical protein n=1 Tax=Weissella paramesenteroides TaxID=1249 RepID=UPI00223BBA0E|nr:hypothetical protein [Weissella paramesenteroides]MCT0486341.1 hypothetical protein [Weissella paramesenteroides]